MAYTINHNRPASASAAEYTLTPYGVASSQYATTDDSAGTTSLTNLSSPLGREETLLLRTRTVPDIYKNTNVDKALFMPTRRGTETTISLRQIWTASDASVANAPEYALPFSVRMTIDVANSPLISETDVLTGIRTFIGALFADGESHIAELLRGATNITK